MVGVFVARGYTLLHVHYCQFVYLCLCTISESPEADVPEYRLGIAQKSN